jgi:hypothetical protein
MATGTTPTMSPKLPVTTPPSTGIRLQGCVNCRAAVWQAGENVAVAQVSRNAEGVVRK